MQEMPALADERLPLSGQVDRATPAVHMTRRQLLTRIGLAILLIVASSILFRSSVRRSILRAAGWALVANDPLEPVDVIVLTLDVDGAGVLEAADLLHRGIATRVAVFADPPDPEIEPELLRRGLPYENMADQDIRELRELGIGKVQRISTEVGGSEDEGPALADWCHRQRYHSVLVVSASDHSRRLRRILRRAMNRRQIRVRICSARYSKFDPDRWWQMHDGIRTETVELEKLLLDMVRHPFS